MTCILSTLMEKNMGLRVDRVGFNMSKKVLVLVEEHAELCSCIEQYGSEALSEGEHARIKQLSNLIDNYREN
jgi:hypothetical protein